MINIYLENDKVYFGITKLGVGYDWHLIISNPLFTINKSLRN